MSKLLITGGRVLTQERELDGGAVSVENGIITGVYETPRPAQPGETVVDARGLYVHPDSSIFTCTAAAGSIS